MSLFNNYWFRWFAGAFLLGVSVTAITRSTNKFKDLKVESVSGRFVFKGVSAWAVVGIILGLVGGVLGLGTGAVAKLARRS